MAGILDWLLGQQQPQAFAPDPNQPATPPQQMPQGGFLHRAGNALLSMGDPYGMGDPNSLSPEQRSQGIGQAMLNAGIGIAGSTARNPIAALGQGMQYAQHQGQQQGDQRLKGLMYKNQLGEMEGKNRTKQYLAGRPKPASFGGSDEDWQLFAASNPAEAFKMVSERPDPNKLITYDENGKPVVNQQYMAAQAAIRAAGRSTVVNNIDMKGEGEFSKVAGKKDAERFDEMLTAGRTANEFRTNLGALTEISKNFQTGKIAEFKATVGPYLQALGVDVSGLGDVQSYEAIIDRMAPAMRVPGSGATSDFEMKKFLSALPQLGRTPGGNATISAVLDGVMANRMKAAEIANQALTGQKSRQDANKEILALPDPLAAWKAAQKTLQAAPAQVPPPPPGFQIQR
jgi:uncharacterized protein YfiM (DUF2279 family)